MFNFFKGTKGGKGADEVDNEKEVEARDAQVKETNKEKEVGELVYAKVITDEIAKKADQYYSTFKFKTTPGQCPDDEALASRPEVESDRYLDLLLLMDCTGSMSDWIELCKRTLKECIEEVKDAYPELQPRVAFVGYRDFGDKSSIFAIQDFTLDIQAAKTAISKERAFGGGDAPEDIQGALYQGLKLSWRKVSVKICYLCADAPCHGKTYHDSHDYHPKGNPGGLVLEDLVMEYSNKEVDLTVYELNAGTKKMYEIMEQAYNQGSNAGEMKRISLQKEIKQAQNRNLTFESYAAPTGVLGSAYRTQLKSDMVSRTAKQYSKHGWI